MLKETGEAGGDQILREEDVDNDMFIFPDRVKEEEEKALEPPQL